MGVVTSKYSLSFLVCSFTFPAYANENLILSKNGTCGADHRSCTGGARITAEGGSLKRDLRAGNVCMSVCMYVCMYVCSSRSVL